MLIATLCLIVWSFNFCKADWFDFIEGGILYQEDLKIPNPGGVYQFRTIEFIGDQTSYIIESQGFSIDKLSSAICVETLDEKTKEYIHGSPCLTSVYYHTQYFIVRCSNDPKNSFVEIQLNINDDTDIEPKYLTAIITIQGNIFVGFSTDSIDSPLFQSNQRQQFHTTTHDAGIICNCHNNKRQES